MKCTFRPFKGLHAANRISIVSVLVYWDFICSKLFYKNSEILLKHYSVRLLYKPHGFFVRQYAAERYLRSLEPPSAVMSYIKHRC